MMRKYALLFFGFIFACLGFTQKANDTLLTVSLSVRQLSFPFSDTVQLATDTLLEGFYQIGIGRKSDPWFTNLGNLGQGGLSNDFQNWSNNEFVFNRAYHNHWSDRDKTEIYYTKRPLTSLTYTNGGSKAKKEQLLRVFHTQNASEKINFGIKYLNVRSLGFYQRQEVTIHNTSLWMNYRAKPYGFYAGLDIDRMKFQENAGFISDSIFNSGNYDDSQYIPVNLSTTLSRPQLTRFRILQNLGIGKYYLNSDSIQSAYRFRLSHCFQYLDQKRSFIDTDPDSLYYPSIFLDSTSTYDIPRQKDIDNWLTIAFPELKLKWMRFSSGLSLHHKISEFSFFNSDTSLQSIFIEGFMLDSLRNWLILKVNGQIGIKGYREGDSRFSGLVEYSIGKNNYFSGLYARISFYRSLPSFWFEHYLSNHYAWENQFQPERRIELNFGLSAFNKKLVIEASQITLDRYLYFLYSGLPTQTEKLTAVFSLKAIGTFDIGLFHSRNSFLVQKAGNENLIRLPALCLKTSNFIEKQIFKTNLLFQFGVEINYRSAFYAYSWLPATAQFVVGDKIKTGNYPFIDLFLNLNIKTVRLFFQYEHINDGMNAQNSYLFVHFPSNPRVFRFGLSWNLLN
jgi:hypothetical protein